MIEFRAGPIEHTLPDGRTVRLDQQFDEQAMILLGRLLEQDGKLPCRVHALVIEGEGVHRWEELPEDVKPPPCRSGQCQEDRCG